MNARIPTGFEPIGHITRSSGRRAYMRFCLGPMASEPIVTSAVALSPLQSRTYVLYSSFM